MIPSDPSEVKLLRRRRYNTVSHGSESDSQDSDNEYPRPTRISHRLVQNTKTGTAGWPIDLRDIFDQIWYIFLVGFRTLYASFLQGGHEMVLGILEFLGGSKGSTSVNGEVEDVVGDGKIMEMGVKRRRKVDGVNLDQGHYPGMVNLSGTLCYMNSVLQSFASIPSLVTHLERNIALAVELDVPTPVADTLLDVLQDLNTPHSRPRRPIRPTALLTALSALPTIQRLLGTREQQDAHELFLVLAEAISVESLKVAGEVAKSRGLGEVLDLQGWAAGKTYGLNGGGMKARAVAAKEKEKKRQRGLAQPWEGLMARRRVCRVCGWCEAVRMEPVRGMELSLPQYGDVTLDACIAQYLAPELLSDVTCEMCSLIRTQQHYQAEYDRLSNPSSSTSPTPSKPIRAGSGSFGALEDLSTLSQPPAPPPGPAEMTPARRKRAKDAKRLVTRLNDMLASGTVSHFGESLIPPTSAGPSTSAVPIKWQKVNTESIRAALITRPPQTLRLHLIRSEYTPYGTLLKKSARVAFPLVLDLTRFVTRGVWDERTGVMGALAAGEGGSDGKNEVQRKVLYRLESVILHYGYTHSSGHYVCIRRKPFKSASGVDWESSRRPRQVNKACPDGCTCESCLYHGQVRDEGDMPGKGWLRVSDDEVEEVGEEALIAARSQVFMLFYERVGEHDGKKKEGMRVEGGKPEEEQSIRDKEAREEDYGQGRKTPEDDRPKAHL